MTASIDNQLEITSLSHDGRGIGRDKNGKTVFIDGALPGEQVTYALKQKKRRFNVGSVIDVLQSSANRVTPKCDHFLTCGGCAQQHIEHMMQLDAKQNSLLEQLQHFGNVTPQNILDPITGPLWGYRTKARLGVRYVTKKDQVLVGFREKHSNYLAEINSCAVLHPKIATLLMPLREFIYTLDARQDIAQLEVAVGDNHLAIIVRNLQPLSHKDMQAWIEFAKMHKFDLYLQPKGPDSVHKVWPQEQCERLYYYLPTQELKFAFHPTDFTQVNVDINQQMVNQTLRLLDIKAEDKILDLYCGLGNFTLPMAQLAQHVTGVEGSEAMVERGYENAKLNNINNVDFFAADLSQDQSTQTWAKQQYDKVLLDPPRLGAEAVLPLLGKMQPNKILYVSCNPATLARDIGILVNNHGYKLTNAGIMDMFPHTLHVEAMALLEL